MAGDDLYGYGPTKQEVMKGEVERRDQAAVQGSARKRHLREAKSLAFPDIPTLALVWASYFAHQLQRLVLAGLLVPASRQVKCPTVVWLPLRN